MSDLPEIRRAACGHWVPAAAPAEFLERFVEPPGPFDPVRVPALDAPAGARALEIRVRPQEVDPLGHANNAVFVDWVDEALAAAGLAVAGPRRYRLEYLLPAMPGEPLRAIAWRSEAEGPGAVRCAIESAAGGSGAADAGRIVRGGLPRLKDRFLLALGAMLIDSPGAGALPKGVFDVFKAAEIGKQILSEAANATAQSARVFGDYEKIVAKFTPEEGTNFIRSMLSGEKVTPELEPLQKALRQEIGKRQNELHNLGILKYFDAHYFPLQWKNPAEASRLAEAGNVFSTGRGAGLGGSPGSLRARTLSGIDEGLARGLELASTNPINLAANMITEMDRFLVARRLMGEFERAGIVKNVRAGEEAPKLWQPIRDKLFSEGNYYAPPSVLRIFNNITEFMHPKHGLSRPCMKHRLLAPF